MTYAAAHSVQTTGASFWLQGGALEVHARFYRGFGVAASATGLQISNNNSLTAPLDVVTIVFGPRYTCSTRSQRLSVFGEALVGEANGFNSVFASSPGPANLNGTTDSANSLAFQTGGGFDLKLAKRVAARAQIDYLRTQFLNGGTNLQNNLRIAAGLVVRLSR